MTKTDRIFYHIILLAIGFVLGLIAVFTIEHHEEIKLIEKPEPIRIEITIQDNEIDTLFVYRNLERYYK